MSNQTVVIIGLLCTLLGSVIGFLTFTRNRDKDVKGEASREASRNAVIETKLDNINQSVNTIALDLKTTELRWINTDKEVARIDESVKSAHKRIDFIENKGDV